MLIFLFVVLPHDRLTSVELRKNENSIFSKMLHWSFCHNGVDIINAMQEKQKDCSQNFLLWNAVSSRNPTPKTRPGQPGRQSVVRVTSSAHWHADRCDTSTRGINDRSEGHFACTIDSSKRLHCSSLQSIFSEQMTLGALI